MLSRAPAARKPGDSHFIAPEPEILAACHPGVKSFTSPAGGGGGRQWWMNCIWVPASSITSPLRKGTESPASGTPLTLGRAAPSTCENA